MTMYRGETGSSSVCLATNRPPYRSRTVHYITDYLKHLLPRELCLLLSAQSRKRKSKPEPPSDWSPIPFTCVHRIAGFDGSPDVAQSIKAGEIKATVLQPVIKLSEEAVVQADNYIRTGKADKPEKQSIDCVLINKDNVGKYTTFGLNE